MKRIHIHIAVNDLTDSIYFYSTIIGVLPSIELNDCANWDLFDPAVNSAISGRGHAGGVNHLGIQVDSKDELLVMSQRLDGAEINVSPQENASCCYSQYPFGFLCCQFQASRHM